MLYQLRVDDQAVNEYLTYEEAIREAQDYAATGHRAVVVAVEQSGTYESRTVVWPTRGETVTA